MILRSVLAVLVIACSPTAAQGPVLAEELERIGALEAGEPAKALELRVEVADRLMSAERFPEACEQYELAVAAARRLGATNEVIACLGNLSIARFRVGQLAGAVRATEAALVLAEEDGPVERVRALANNLGSIHLRRGDYELALDAFSRSLDASDPDGEPIGMAALLSNIGVAHMYLGDYDEALDLFVRAAEKARTAGDRLGEASMIANQGDAHHLAGNHRQALTLHRLALEMRQESGQEREIALSHRSLGVVLDALDDRASALEHLELALEIQRRLEIGPDIVATLSAIANAKAAGGDGDAALAAATEALELAEEIGVRGRQVEALDAMSAAHEASGDPANALAFARRARRLEREIDTVEMRRRFGEHRERMIARSRAHELAMLESEAGFERDVRSLLVFGLGLLLVIALIGWSQFLLKRRAYVALDRANRGLQTARDEAEARARELRSAMDEIQTLERERQRADRLESLGLLAGGIAHDYNNLFGVLLGNLSLARRQFRGDVDETFARSMGDAEAAIQQARRLTNQLLTFAKGGAPVVAVHSLDEIIRDSVALASSGSSAVVKCDTEPGLWPVEIDAGQISQVLANLILNAVQAMPDGGTAFVSARNVAGDEPTVEVSVRDAGVGIPSEIRERVFDPYFSTKPEGTGLGLTTAHAIVRRHGGRLRIDSEPGRGTDVTFILPAVPGAEPSAAQPRSTSNRGAGRVLVVDDEPLLHSFYAGALKQLGYRPEVVEDAAAALASVRRARADGDPFRVAVIDLTLRGGVDGVAVLGRLRAEDPDVRAIVASGYSDAPVLANPGGTGFQGVLPKPFSTSQLSAALEEALRGG